MLSLLAVKSCVCLHTDCLLYKLGPFLDAVTTSRNTSKHIYDNQEMCLFIYAFLQQFKETSAAESFKCLSLLNVYLKLQEFLLICNFVLLH